MKVYVVTQIDFVYSPHEFNIYTKVFTDKYKAEKYFNDKVKEIRIDAYGVDEGQGYLNEDSFELMVDQKYNEYEVKLILECEDLIK